MLKHNDIPEELLVKIFIVQSAKSLLRLRSVCKSWYKVISSEFFVKSHLAYQKTSLNRNKYLLIRYPPSYFTTLVDGETCNNFLESHKNDMYNMHENYPWTLPLEPCGICDGLLCLSHVEYFLNSDNPIYLWNPIVRKVKKLPRIENRDIGRSYLCFGHHNDDYKVINVIPLRRVYKVHIYSLSQDSWNLLEFNKESNDTDEFEIGPRMKARFVNGSAYFVRSIKRGSRVVVCFDLSCKIIRQINLPCNDFSLNFFMEEYQGCIALLEDKRDHVIIWGLRVSDNSYLWNKEFKIKIKLQTPSFGAAMVKSIGAVCFIDKDKVVLRMITNYSGNKYFLFNLENKSQQRQQLTTLERFLEEVEVDEYKWCDII